MAVFDERWIGRAPVRTRMSSFDILENVPPPARLIVDIAVALAVSKKKRARILAAAEEVIAVNACMITHRNYFSLRRFFLKHQCKSLAEAGLA